MFRFKQFSIAQDRCAMKICTDACILGAYAEVKTGDTVLDIGTGTGLLSMMLAQRGGAFFDAVELDDSAALQAKENVSESPFDKKITVHLSDILTFPKKGFDLIISNPPFFTNQLQAPSSQKNKAKHTVSLSKSDLAQVIAEKLNPMGKCIILLPPEEMQLFQKEMQKVGLYINSTLAIRHHKEKPVFRQICTFEKSKKTPFLSELYIYETDNTTYSEEFTRLLKDYYIIF